MSLETDVSEIVRVRDDIFGKKPETTWRGDDVPIHSVDHSTALYKMAAAGRYLFLTQNIRKPSPNTDWVLSSPDHELLWLARRGSRRSMIAKVVRFANGHGMETIEVHRFAPDRSSEVIKVYFRRISDEQ